jgi:hypothetical protein
MTWMFNGLRTCACTSRSRLTHWRLPACAAQRRRPFRGSPLRGRAETRVATAEPTIQTARAVPIAVRRRPTASRGR